MTKFVVYASRYNEWAREEYQGKVYALSVAPEDKSIPLNLREPDYPKMARIGVKAIFPVDPLNAIDGEWQSKLANDFCDFLNAREAAAEAALQAKLGETAAPVFTDPKVS